MPPVRQGHHRDQHHREVLVLLADPGHLRADAWAVVLLALVPLDVHLPFAPQSDHGAPIIAALAFARQGGRTVQDVIRLLDARVARHDLDRRVQFVLRPGLGVVLAAGRDAPKDVVLPADGGKAHTA